MNLKILNNDLIQCEKCELIKDGERPVQFSHGSYTHYMFVGYVPTEEDKANGVPFSGNTRPGKNLRRLIELSGVPLKYCYFTFLCKCHTKVKNTKPFGMKVYNCYLNWMDSELELAKPKIVFMMGKQVVEFFNEYKYHKDLKYCELPSVNTMINMKDRDIIKIIEEAVI